MRIISSPVLGSFITKSPKPKFFIMALPKSTGSFLEFLSRNTPSNSLTNSAFSLSDDSIIIGKKGSFARKNFAKLIPASVTFSPFRLKETSLITPSMFFPNFS